MQMTEMMLFYKVTFPCKFDNVSVAVNYPEFLSQSDKATDGI